MGTFAPSFVTVNPSFTMPEVLMPIFQASGAFDCLYTGAPMTRLSDGDLQVYINRLDVRTKVAAGQSAYNQLPSCSIEASQINTPTYLQRVRAEYDHHDTSAAARRGFSIVAGQSLAMRQGHAQLQRSALLYGFNPASGEGLLNAAGATSIALPDDSNGNDTVVTYDNGEMAFFLAQQIAAIKVRTYQLGIGRDFTILAPQRILAQWGYNVVQLVQFQRPGAGTTSTAGTVDAILMANGDKVMFVCDDTLENKGLGGNTDAVLIVMPEVEQPKGKPINTNIFSDLTPNMAACTLMLNDMVAPREIPTPISGGAIDVLSELRTTSGWGIRPEVITICSMTYE